MSRDRQPHASSAQIGELREHAQLFASRMPGPLRLLRMRAGDVSIEVHWHDAARRGQADASQAAGAGGAAAAVSDEGQDGAGTAGAAEAGDDQRVLVTAPMVGTFYRAPSPGANPFVKVGDLVEPGQTVGIVEAMKLMNSVIAECAGQVTEIIAEDAQPVEYAQPLIAIAATEP